MRLTKYQYNRLQADIGGLTTLYAIIKAEKNQEKNLNRGFDLGSYWRRKRDSNSRFRYPRTNPLAGGPLIATWVFLRKAAHTTYKNHAPKINA